MKTTKKPISIRLDVDVLVWFKTVHPKYQTKINEILRDFKEKNQHEN